MPRPCPARFSLMLIGLLLPAAGQAQAPVSEAAMKAAFVYNFVRFAEWSHHGLAQPPEPVRLCLFGSPDPFLAALRDIDGKSAQSRLIAVRRVTHPAEFKECHILAIAEGESGRQADLARLAAESGSLTVAENRGFIDAGGTIGFVVSNDKVQFEINLESARQANLTLSSHLLKLARRIRR